MSESRSMLQVYFEDPFWVGLFQRWEDGSLRVCKVTFGAEPREQEVYQLILTQFFSLSFSPPVADTDKGSLSGNPKRRQRQARALTERRAPGTKSQQAVQLQREATKEQRRECTRQKKLASAALRFEKKQQKRKARHRGH